MSDIPPHHGVLLCLVSLATSTALFSAIYRLLQFLQARRMFPGMRPDRLSTDLSYAANWLVSAVQAVGAGLMGVAVTRSTSGSLMDTPCGLVRWYGWASLGYWLYDTGCMYTIVTRERERKSRERDSFLMNVFLFVKWWPMLVVHHVAIVGVVIPAIVMPSRVRGDGIIGMSFLMEWSSLFVAARSALSRLGYKETLLYRVVGLSMVVTFFLVRILLLPAAVYLYSSQADVTVYQGIVQLPNICKVGTAAFCSLNLYWFSLMVMGIRKALFQKQAAKNE